MPRRPVCNFIEVQEITLKLAGLRNWSFKSNFKAGVVVHAFNASTQEAEAGRCLS